MKRVARYHPLAEQEFSDAVKWYERQRVRLAAAFVGAVEACVTAILDEPPAGRVIHSDVRRRLVRKFPYAVLYRITGEGIRILAIMNLHRRPGYWIGRS